jgi:predicted Zn-ribbon and HTH transcriptional regulator
MGSVVDPTCRACGHHWQHEILGGTFAARILRCLSCGRPRAITDEDLPRSSGGAWAVEEEVAVHLLGPCECGGLMSTTAPLRCPSCHSAEVDEGPVYMNVD